MVLPQLRHERCWRIHGDSREVLRDPLHNAFILIGDWSALSTADVRLDVKTGFPLSRARSGEVSADPATAAGKNPSFHWRM